MPKPQSSSPRPSYPRAVSIDPQHFRPEFDVLHELTHNRHAYEGDQWLSLRAFPGFLRTNIDRLRSHLPSAAPLSTVVCCLVSEGLRRIQGHEEVQRLVELKKELDTLPPATNAEDADEIAGWFRSFPVGMPNLTLSGVRRSNITLTTSVKVRLDVASEGLGVSQASLAVLAMVICLADQTECLDGHRRLMESTLEKFSRRIQMRCRVAEVLLSFLKS